MSYIRNLSLVGDLLLTCDLNKDSFVILANSELDEPDESCSPHYLDDYRFGCIEGKIHTSQSDSQIQLQLQANVVLSTVEQLKHHVKQGIPKQEILSLKTITTHGIAVCATDRNNLLLRLTADFTTSNRLSLTSVTHKFSTD